MFRIMFQYNGMGLAAPQVGYDKRIIVMRDPDNREKALAFVNPIIVRDDGAESSGREGCLSFPGQDISIKRKWAIDLEFEKINSDERLICHFEGLNARCIQHEIDHLNGVMIFDHIKANLSRKLAMDKYLKHRRRV